MSLSPNSLAFIALCNEYCNTIQAAGHSDADAQETSPRQELVAAACKLLPRIYICAGDLITGDPSVDVTLGEEDAYISPSLDEDAYDQTRQRLETIMGPEDTYLETFHEDMKFSDTPIAANISEGLTDLFQVFYDFIEAVKDAPIEAIQNALTAVSDDFGAYWGQIICNVMRPLNYVRFNSSEDSDNADF